MKVGLQLVYSSHTKKTACHICCACLTIWKVLKEAVVWFIYFLSDDFDKILYLFYCLMYYYLIMSQMILIHLSGFWWWNNLRSDLFVFLVVMLRFLKYLLTVWWQGSLELRNIYKINHHWIPQGKEHNSPE